MAQPLLKKEQLRKRFDLYLNGAELALIAVKAKSAHLPVSGFIRRSALGQKIQVPPTAISIRGWSAMARVGNNLNQLAQAVATGRAHGIDPEIIHNVAEQVRLLRLEIIGAVGDSK